MGIKREVALLYRRYEDLKYHDTGMWFDTEDEAKEHARMLAKQLNKYGGAMFKDFRLKVVTTVETVEIADLDIVPVEFTDLEVL